MTYEVQQTRWDRIIRRVSGSIGPGSRVSETISELFPMIDVERVPGELLLLGGTGLGVGANNTAGDAGEFARHQLFNPAGSGVIATVTKLIVCVFNTQTIRIEHVIIPSADGIGTEVFRDGRHAITSRPVCQIRSESNAAATGGNWQIRMLANTCRDLKDENGVAVLSPGTGLEVGLTSAATVLVSTFLWRERPAEQAELQF